MERQSIRRASEKSKSLISQNRWHAKCLTHDICSFSLNGHKRDLVSKLTSTVQVERGCQATQNSSPIYETPVIFIFQA